MKTSEIYSSGVLNKGEAITECFNGKFSKGNETIPGFIVFTNHRFIFLRKPPGLFAKGLNMVVFSSWGDILSVSTTGMISKRLNISIHKQPEIVNYVFSCDNVTVTAQRIIIEKNKYVDTHIIEAQKIIIEEANKDNAMSILQKRLARGEISLEEFNKLVQRT
jgi:hypothetical protein